jgi:two-component sensor histidine kinase
MRIFNPPKTSYDNYYKQGVFDLTWRYNAFMFFSYLLLILVGSLFNWQLFLIGFACWCTPALSLLVMYKTKRYEVVAYIQVILGTVVTGIILNLNLVQFHATEVIFMGITVLYSFMTLPKIIGMASLLIQGVWLMLFLFTSEPKYTEPQVVELYSVCISLLVAASLFGFLIIEFLKLRHSAEYKYVQANSDLIKINQLVNAQNQEKTVMLKEIHHRVKNNLQVVSSLLRLQSYEINEKDSQLQFQDAINRVSAMALIHEKMYQNENLSLINFENYIHSLASDLVRSHSTDLNIKLTVNSEIKEVGNDTLVPMALILNELITNSLKHAFIGRNDGIISIEMCHTTRPNFFNFIYKDNGNWTTNPQQSSFGLELISSLTEQLDGEMNRTFEEGTRYDFVLKNLK